MKTKKTPKPKKNVRPDAVEPTTRMTPFGPVVVVPGKPRAKRATPELRQLMREIEAVEREEGNPIRIQAKPFKSMWGPILVPWVVVNRETGAAIRSGLTDDEIRAWHAEVCG